METTFHRRPHPISPSASVKGFLTLFLVLGGLVLGYRSTLTPVRIMIDGRERRLRTHQDTVGALLLDAGVNVDPTKDLVTPGVTAPIEAESAPFSVYIRRARPVQVTADDQTITIETHATAIEKVLKEARVSLGPSDELRVEGDLAASSDGEMAHLLVTRAKPFVINEDGHQQTYHTTARTVGEALRRADITVHLADRVSPGLGNRLVSDMNVRIERSTPIQVVVDGRTLRTRTHREQVGQVLADLKIVLAGQDYTSPTMTAPLGDNDTIQVVRVRERFVIEEEPIPFESIWQPDPDLEIDNEHLIQEGAPGTLQRRVRIRYENDTEVERIVENEYVAVSPTTRIQGYGTKIVVRTLQTPSGPVEYWRVFRMLATSYSAGTAGTSPSSPWYGRTATGMKMRHGIVAVDPGVVPLRTEVYVPGYGVGYAGDTGGAIKGYRIDLGYDDDNLQLWYKWVDVYLLTPVPSQINYYFGP
jgi:uncharacterized protein YabE (DUF348 family)